MTRNTSIILTTSTKKEPHLVQNIKNDIHINNLNIWAKARNLV